MRALSLALVGSAVVAAGVGAWLAFGRGEAPRGPTEAREDFSLVPRSPHVARSLTGAERADLLPLLTAYLDAGSEKAFKDRLALLERLKTLRASDCDLLADPETLLGLVYESRTFLEPEFDAHVLPKGAAGAEIRNALGPVHRTSVSWDPLRLSLSIPLAYPLGDEKRTLDHAPWPMIVTLAEPEDDATAAASGGMPGDAVLARRYDPAGSMKDAALGWIVLAATAPKGRFVAEDGKLRGDAVLSAVRATWQRYHVDFDRFVLDGGSDALALAASQPFLYAGLVVRGDDADVDPAVVRNFAPLAVYVVGTEKSAAFRSMKAGGFPMQRVFVGDVAGLPGWLATVVRTPPMSFHWTMKDRAAMGQAYWATLDAVDDTGTPTLDVSAVDTKDDPNTIRIASRGVRSVSLFLSDRVVDLDRDVRVVANGHVVARAVRSGAGRPTLVALPSRLERSLDAAFDHRLISARRSQYFGWLHPAMLASIPTSSAAATSAEAAARDHFAKAQAAERSGDGKAAAALYAKASAEGPSDVWEKACERCERVRNAAGYVQRAEQAERAGDTAKARGFYEKAADEGDTPYEPIARAKLNDLKGR